MKQFLIPLKHGGGAVRCTSKLFVADAPMKEKSKKLRILFWVSKIVHVVEGFKNA